MKSLWSLLAALTLTSAASSQVLSEDFSSGVPPTGWTHVNHNGNGVGWIPDGTGRAWHEDENLGGLASDNHLVSPAFDLTGVAGTKLTFDGETNYATYLANNPAGYGNGISNMEITTDGGLTWIMVWTDTSLVNGFYSPCVNISAFDGMTNVQLGIYFFGDYAQEWWVDNVVIEGGGGCGGSGGALTYSVTGLLGGSTATATITGAMPGGNILIGYSLTGAGPTVTPYGSVDMSAPITAMPMQTADFFGDLTLQVPVPTRASGQVLYSQAVDLGSGSLTPSIAESIL
jgi:hypothetical protein